jgi:hypothetical protein
MAASEGMLHDDRRPRVLVCVDCREEFVFPISAQEYFEEQGYAHQPKRCKACHSRFKRDQKVAG